MPVSEAYVLARSPNVSNKQKRAAGCYQFITWVRCTNHASVACDIIFIKVEPPPPDSARFRPVWFRAFSRFDCYAAGAEYECRPLNVY